MVLKTPAEFKRRHTTLLKSIENSYKSYIQTNVKCLSIPDICDFILPFQIALDKVSSEYLYHFINDVLHQIQYVVSLPYTLVSHILTKKYIYIYFCFTLRECVYILFSVSKPTSLKEM